jgi:hypothetical protein
LGGAEWIPGRLICGPDLSPAERLAGGSEDTKVKRSRFISLTLIRRINRIWLIPRLISDAIERRRQRMVMQELEVERLDRIRNPSKYRGK